MKELLSWTSTALLDTPSLDTVQRALLFALALLIPIYTVFIPIYNLTLHPLSTYPGPKLWAAYRFPYVYSLQQGNLVHDTKRIHDKYGRLVRLAPNELSTIDAQAWQDIYGHRAQGRPEFQKNPIWAQPTPNGEYSLINASEVDHRRMRKPLAPAFSVRAIKDNEGTLQLYIGLLVDQIRKAVIMGRPVVDMRDYYNWTTFDVFGDLGFGEPFNCLKEERYHEWVSFLFSHLKAAALMASINFYPTLKWILFKCMPKSVFAKAVAHHNMSADKVKRRLQRKTNKKDIISYLVKEDRAVMSIGELEATTATLILAGSEGTSALLTSTTNLLVRNPEKLQRLTKEVRTSFQSESEIVLDKLEKLPYIEAVLREGMRVAPPVPTAIPRIVPPLGDIVSGIRLPGNTFIGVHQFAAYRHVTNFIYPDAFIPERWLKKDSAFIEPCGNDPPFDSSTFELDRNEVLQPFSVGPRSCAGTTLARHELRLIIARLVYNFDLSLPEQTYRRKLKPYSMPGIFKWEEQKTYSLWEREPCEVQFKLRPCLGG